MQESRKYFGRGKVFSGKYGDMPTLSFNKTELTDLLQIMDSQGTEWVSLNIKRRKDADKFGNTLYGELYIKDAPKPSNIQEAQVVDESDDLPF